MRKDWNLLIPIDARVAVLLIDWKTVRVEKQHAFSGWRCRLHENTELSFVRQSSSGHVVWKCRNRVYRNESGFRSVSASVGGLVSER
jgi:hypothetical protein